jgi:flavorubredoxin
MKAIIIYHTRYGNTERIAKSLEIGLKEASGIQDVVCTNVRDIVSAPKPIKQFLGKMKGVNLAGKYGFAFDTRLSSRFSGSAAKYIEKELKSQGLQIISPLESAIVFALKDGARLKEGEDKRFKQVGLHVGSASVQSGSNILDTGQ